MDRRLKQPITKIAETDFAAAIHTARLVGNIDARIEDLAKSTGIPVTDLARQFSSLLLSVPGGKELGPEDRMPQMPHPSTPGMHLRVSEMALVGGAQSLLRGSEGSVRESDDGEPGENSGRRTAATEANQEGSTRTIILDELRKLGGRADVRKLNDAVHGATGLDKATIGYHQKKLAGMGRLLRQGKDYVLPQGERGLSSTIAKGRPRSKPARATPASRVGLGRPSGILRSNSSGSILVKMLQRHGGTMHKTTLYRSLEQEHGRNGTDPWPSVASRCVARGHIIRDGDNLSLPSGSTDAPEVKSRSVLIVDELRRHHGNMKQAQLYATLRAAHPERHREGWAKELSSMVLKGKLMRDDQGNVSFGASENKSRQTEKPQDKPKRGELGNIIMRYMKTTKKTPLQTNLSDFLHKKHPGYTRSAFTMAITSLVMHGRLNKDAEGHISMAQDTTTPSAEPENNGSNEGQEMQESPAP